MGKFHEMIYKKQNLSTRPGNVDDTSSKAVTGIAAGDPGSNPKKKGGRKRADTPLGPPDGNVNRL